MPVFGQPMPSGRVPSMSFTDINWRPYACTGMSADRMGIAPRFGRESGAHTETEIFQTMEKRRYLGTVL